MTLEELQNIDQTYGMPVFSRTPLCIARGEGTTLYDEKGNAYTDLFAGIAVCSLGYGHPALSQALHSQVDRLLHTSNVFYNEPQMKLLQVICRATGYLRAFLCSSGAEANEGAIKLARKYFYKQGIERYGILSANDSFHGRTLATVAATGQIKYQAPYRPLPAGFRQVPYGDVEALEQAIDAHTAAVLLEPIQGEGGIIVPPPEYLSAVRALCDQKGILLIFDEVQTGAGRCGHTLLSTSKGVQADIVTMAKGMGGGVPIGAFLATEKVAQAFEPGDHGTTYGGNPLCCAASLAVFDTLLADGFFENVRQLGMHLRESVRALKLAPIVDVRGEGLLTGIEFNPDYPVAALQRALLQMGMITGIAAHNTLRIAPPLIIKQEQLDAFVEALPSALNKI